MHYTDIEMSGFFSMSLLFFQFFLFAGEAIDLNPFRFYEQLYY